MKQTKIFIISVFILFGCSEQQNEKTSSNSTYKTRIDYFVPKGENVIQEITIPGSVIPFEQVTLYSEVSGRVEKIHFKEGEIIQKGAPIIKIDTDILVSNKDRIATALSFAEKDLARKKKLYESEAGTFQEYEQAEAEVARLNAELNEINVQIKKSTLYAPFSGRIGLRDISEGAFIGTNDPIAVLAQVEKVKISFSIPQRYANRVKTGQQINVKTTGLEDYSKAKVYAFDPVVAEGTRMLNIRATLSDSATIFPGSFVQVVYNLGEVPNSIMIPTAAITPVLNGQQVWLKKNGKAKSILVETGVRTADKVQIFGDIKIGDTVVTTGLLSMNEGMSLGAKNENQ